MRARTIFSLLPAVTIAFLLPAAPLAAQSAKQPAGQDSLQPLSDSAWDYAKARHLLFRAGFGGPPEEVQKLCGLGLRKAVESLVDYRSQPDVEIPMAAGFKGLEPPDLVKLSPQERLQVFQKKKPRDDFQAMQELRRWWVTKMIRSPRPLEEKLVLFWHGLFATEHRTVRNSISMSLQNQLFREHAAGNYAKLLHAMLRDPAMLRYLDNNRNVKGKPNENLAREIMELFSMGEGQGYTEQDVREGARALTGYTFDPKTLQPRFLPKSHDPDEKTILGKKGKWNGEQFVDLILAHPATSRFIAMRLFKYFAHEEPDAALIDRLAKVLRDNNYEVAPLLRTIFLSREFYSPRATATHYKSPAHLVVGTARILGAKTYDGGALALAMRNMGQDLFDPPNVKGWEGGETWINSVTIFARQNFTSALVGQGIGKGAIKAKAPKKLKKATGPLVRDLDLIAPLERRNLTTPAQVVDYYTKALLLAPLDEQRRAQLLRLVGDLPAPSQWAERRQEINQRLGALIILITSLPEYQLA